MEKLFLIAAGAVGVGVAWVGFLTLKHGWGWVVAWWHRRVAKAEADFQAKVANALPSVLAPINADLANIKNKLSITPSPVTPPTPPAT